MISRLKRKSLERRQKKLAKTVQDGIQAARSAADKLKKSNIIHDNAVQPYFNRGLRYGGLYNAASGIGSNNDKSKWSVFLPTIVDNSSELQVIVTESWAARRFINLPIDQMFMKPRVIENMEEDKIRQYHHYWQKMDVQKKLSDAMKSGRLYGTAFLLFITKEAPLTSPLDINQLKAGDLLNVLVFDRYSMNVLGIEYKVTSPNFQQPIMYNVFPKYGNSFDIHHSRVLRFDGLQPLTSNMYQNYNQYYGVSELIPVMQSIYQEAQAAHGISNLIEEASIPIMEIEGLKDVLGGCADPTSATLEQLVELIQTTKSIYNMIVHDSSSEFRRETINFGGLPEILDRFAFRLAAAAEIPATIFLGKSPVGMNATGESDLSINASKVQTDQENKLRPILNKIDQILLRTCGLPPKMLDFQFPSIFDMSDETKADILLKTSQSIATLSDRDIITTDESRKILSEQGYVGELPPQGFDFNSEIEKARLSESSTDETDRRSLQKEDS